MEVALSDLLTLSIIFSRKVVDFDVSYSNNQAQEGLLEHGPQVSSTGLVMIPRRTALGPAVLSLLSGSYPIGISLCPWATVATARPEQF